jgi:hypothetical protein
MILPDDNSITLADGNDALALDHTDRPAPTIDAVLAFLPGWARENAAPIRDAILAAYAAMGNLAWARIGQAVGRLASPRDADGAWLDQEWGELLKRPRAAGEIDPPYRARLLAQPEIISPNAIQAAALAILTRFTEIAPEFVEPAVDGIYYAPADPNSGCPWTAFWQSTSRRLWADYPESVNRTVGARWVAANAVPEFWIGIVGGNNEQIMYFVPVVIAQDPAHDADLDFFGAVPPSGAWFASDARFLASADGAMAEQIITDVESRRGAGVRWMLFIDPLLGSAL